jgi:Tol biopolymer transport system component
MSENHELGQTLRTLLMQEADAMEIDTHEATERLVRELGPTESRRRPIVVALVACAVVVVALLAWSNRGDVRRDLAPADDRTPSPQVAEEPYYLDLAAGDRTPAPPEAAALFETSGDLVFSPSGDRVAYSSCLMGAGRCSAEDQFFLADADGSDPLRLDPPAGLNAYFPAWSPDGTKLVYQARQGGVADVGNLYVHDLDTGETTRITDFDLSLPMWWPVTSDVSLDGEHVVYSIPRTADLQTTWDVWEVPVAGGDATRLFENAESPHYLADGRIAFLRPGSGDSPDTLLAAAQDGEPQVLVEFAAEGGTAVSPDRTRIAYVDDGVLHLLDIASGRSDVLAETEGFAWVGDERLLVVPGPGPQ